MVEKMTQLTGKLIALALAAFFACAVSPKVATADEVVSHASSSTSVTVSSHRTEAEGTRSQTDEIRYLKSVKYNLTMYRKLLSENQEILKTAIDELLSDGTYGEIKSLGYILRGALDGLSFGLLLKGASAAKAVGAVALAGSRQAGAYSSPVNQWLENGGLETLKGLAKSGGLIGVSGVANRMTLPGYELQFAVPILQFPFGEASYSQTVSDKEFLQRPIALKG